MEMREEKPMSLQERIFNDLKSAMKEKDEVRVRTLRMVVTAIQYYLVDHESLSDEEMTHLLAKELKTREESLEEYLKANRDDLVSIEKADIEVIRSYLPKPMTKEEILALIERTLQEVSAHSVQDLGKVMAKVSPLVRGKADGKLVNALVREALSQRS
jgi:uncharacterized protein YqeY